MTEVKYVDYTDQMLGRRYLEKIIFTYNEELNTYDMTKTMNRSILFGSEWILKENTGEHLGFYHETQDKFSVSKTNEKKKYYKINLDGKLKPTVIHNQSFYTLLIDSRSNTSSTILCTDKHANDLITVPAYYLYNYADVIGYEMSQGELPIEILETMSILE